MGKKVWVPWLEAGDCKSGTINSGFRYGQEIAVVCDKGGALYALSNKMPPISQTAFKLKDGKATGKWCPSPVGRLYSLLFSPSDIPVFPVRKRGNAIEVQVNVNAKLQFESKYWRGVLDSQGKVDGGYY